MGSVTAEEMRALEEAAFRQGATPAGLMETAGRRLGQALARRFPRPGAAVAYLGKGHNAGDALIALRVLAAAGWEVSARAAYAVDEWSELTRRVHEGSGVPILEAPPDATGMARPLVLLDGLLGIGAKGGLRGPLVPLGEEMRLLRETRGASVAAVDLPSGVDPDDGTIHPGAVHADVTFTLGVPKRGLLRSSAASAVGALELIPLPGVSVPPAGIGEAMISPWTLGVGHCPRPFDFHKGMAGRVAILAGSAAYTGAAVLAATGALRGGAGLVTLHVPPEAHGIISAKCPPEVMVRPVSHAEELLDFQFQCLVTGPGLGPLGAPAAESLRRLLRESPAPCVIDADALNTLGPEGLEGLPEAHVLTPHPGEFRRLARDLADLPREEAARAFTARHAPVLLLKGARTLVTSAGEPLWCNSTGTPGMASGGQGDALSGVIGALVAGGLPSLSAAAMGAWLCGRASELAITAGHSEESLLAGDTLAFLGAAFKEWRSC